MKKIRTPKEVLAMAKDSVDFVKKLSEMDFYSTLLFDKVNGITRLEAIAKLNEIIKQAQIIMKGEGPTGQVNNHNFTNLGL